MDIVCVDAVSTAGCSKLASDGEAEEWKKRGDEQYIKWDCEDAIASWDKALEFKPDYHLA